MLYTAGARLSYESGDHERLRQQVASAVTLQRFLGLPRIGLEILYTQILEALMMEDLDVALSLARQGCQLTESLGLQRYSSRFAAMEVDISLKHGDMKVVKDWMAATPMHDAGDLLHIEENLVYARCLLQQNRLDDARQYLDVLQNIVLRAEYNRHLITVLTLKAILVYRQRDYTQAMQHLEQALLHAVRRGYRRAILDEGEQIKPLLNDFRILSGQRTGEKKENASLQLLVFTEELLTSLSAPVAASQPRHAEACEPLSEREKHILQLIATGHSNKEIAGILVIAVSTVKSHINSLYGKIGARRRTQAIAIARELGLLSQ
jgi:LuxR family maltose regulon positive regulatory protein